MTERPAARSPIAAPAMQRPLASAITAAVIALLLWSALRSGASRPPVVGAIAPAFGLARPPEPPYPFAAAEARVRNLLENGRRGDVESYLATFTGSLRDRIRSEVRDRGPARFADELRLAASARKSHAVFAAEPDGPGACRIVVEAVYPDRNERQTYRLEYTPSGWFIAAVESVRSRAPEEKYGSPAGFVMFPDTP